MTRMLGEYPSTSTRDDPMVPSRFRFFSEILYAISLLVITTSPQAQSLVGYKVEGEPLTREEVRALEPVCRLIFSAWSQGDAVWYVELRNNPILNRPEYAMAKDAPWAHHYCWAKVSEFRFFSNTNKQKRDYYLKNIHNNIDFCITHGTPENWLYLPLMYVTKARAYRMEQKNIQAIEAVHQALRIYPDYAGGYYLLGEIYEDMGLPSKALEVVSEGLRRNPDSTFLKRRFTALGGGERYPPPYPGTGRRGTPDSGTDTGVEPRRNSSLDSAGSGKPDQADDTSAGFRPVAPQAQEDQYCRFCPKPPPQE